MKAHKPRKHTCKQRATEQKAHPKTINRRKKDTDETKLDESESQLSGEPELVYALFEDETFRQTTKTKKIEVYREDKFTQELEISELHDFSLATFLMTNRVGVWIPKGNFEDSMEVEWKVVPIKVKRIK
jgi:hypothetical protein